MRVLNRVPWTLVLVLCWAGARSAGAQLAINSASGIIILIAAFGALVVEFMRSADITVARFKFELAMAVVAVGCASAMTALLFTMHLGITLADIIVWIVVLVNAWVCPVNSFKTALRNITTDVGIGQSPPNEGGNQ